MRYNVNIVVTVDVIRALSEKTLANSIYLMDDSSLYSTGKGTPGLITRCVAGQVIKWTCYALDLQTPLSINSIAFLPLPAVPPAGNPDLLEWSGTVPGYLVPGLPYYYRLELKMGEGVNSTMHIDTAAIMVDY
jgi:hypothetical protein